MMTALLSPLLALLLCAPQTINSPKEEPVENPYLPGHSNYELWEGSVDASELGIDVFVPEYTSSHELITIAGQLTNNRIAVRGTGPNVSVVENRDRLIPLGDSIAVIDVPAGRAQVLGILRELDLKVGLERKHRMSREAAPESTTVTYTPRHIELPTAFNSVAGQPPGSGIGLEAIPLYEVGSLLLRGTEAQVARAVELLRSIDLPRKQVLLTIYAIAPHEGPTSAGLPGELVNGLAQLVPGTNFDLLGSASVRTAVGNNQVKLESTLRDGEDLSFSAKPSGYDQGSGEIFLGDCSLYVNSRRNADGPNRETRVSTSVSVSVDEYVVLAAAGGDRTFFVVHTQEG
ncbi:hypothetical protein [Engelhardtia mirabilis]|uniref:NolW-like domain-containing protein n=1 Tax=Engelhardtia mirabilis TaxID=2528011 RepID=A0A518BF87_9BACT|nr:hypothetical protein Pla133_06870 [Planctomycetes bacterium Pla133]QDU99947.1 hypothetical protein Pla86_06860 [Planctomycetes bacterium Pla86]